MTNEYEAEYSSISENNIVAGDFAELEKDMESAEMNWALSQLGKGCRIEVRTEPMAKAEDKNA
jgi:hypothetical protein